VKASGRNGVAFVCRSRDFADAAAEHLAVLIAGDIAAELCAMAIECAARASISCCLNVSAHRARRSMPRLRDQTMRSSCKRVANSFVTCARACASAPDPQSQNTFRC
jgi:hypothetical protein